MDPITISSIFSIGSKITFAVVIYSLCFGGLLSSIPDQLLLLTALLSVAVGILCSNLALSFLPTLEWSTSPRKRRYVLRRVYSWLVQCALPKRSYQANTLCRYQPSLAKAFQGIHPCQLRNSQTTATCRTSLSLALHSIYKRGLSILGTACITPPKLCMSAYGRFAVSARALYFFSVGFLRPSTRTTSCLLNEGFLRAHFWYCHSRRRMPICNSQHTIGLLVAQNENLLDQSFFGA